jgi:hypothetical protein
VAGLPRGLAKAEPIHERYEPCCVPFMWFGINRIAAATLIRAARRIFGFALWKTAAKRESLFPASVVLKSPRQSHGGLGDDAQSVRPAVAVVRPRAHDIDNIWGVGGESGGKGHETGSRGSQC